ncbi:hypothetical protein D3C87_1328590 [compost metagenome]
MSLLECNQKIAIKEFCRVTNGLSLENFENVSDNWLQWKRDVVEPRVVWVQPVQISFRIKIERVQAQSYGFNIFKLRVQTPVHPANFTTHSKRHTLHVTFVLLLITLDHLSNSVPSSIYCSDAGYKRLIVVDEFIHAGGLTFNEPKKREEHHGNECDAAQEEQPPLLRLTHRIPPAALTVSTRSHFPHGLKRLPAGIAA